MTRRKKILLIVGGSITGLYILSTIFSGGPDLPDVKTAIVEKSDIIENVSASGKIQPEMEVNISAEVSGQLIQLPVKEGDYVIAGDLLAEINPDLYVAAQNRAQAAVNTSRSNLASSLASKATSEANLFLTEQAWERNQSLFSQGVISQADYDQSEAAFKTASANLTSASEGVKSAKFAILSAEASLQEAEDNLSRTKLIAPQAGIVTALIKEIGESVQGNGFTAGEIIMKISNLDIMEVDVEVNESDIISVAIGNDAEIEVDAYLGQTFLGRVTEIGNTALNASATGFNLDQVTNFSVKIRIDSTSYVNLTNSSAPFRPGMSATVDIKTKYALDVISIPIQCVTSRQDTLGVFVYRDGTAIWAPVKVGIQDNQMIEIISGLEPDQSVISGPYDMVARKLNDNENVVSSNIEESSEERNSEGFSMTIE